MYKACACMLSINWIGTCPFRLPPREFCAVLKLQFAGFSHFRTHCFLQTLEAPADFTTLVLSTK